MIPVIVGLWTERIQNSISTPPPASMVLSALVLPFPLESRLRPPIKGLVWSFASTLEAEPHFDDASVSCRNVNINPNVKTRRVIATPPRVGKLFWCCVGAM